MKGFHIVSGPRNTSAQQTPTNLTSGAANSVGGYQQLLASAAQDIMGFWIWSDVTIGASNTATGMLMNVAFGAAGSEAIQVANIPWGARGVQSASYIPLHIPRGTEVRANIQAAIVNDIFDPRIIFDYAPWNGSFQGFTTADAFGINTAISEPTTGDLTDNAWDVCITSTTRPYRALTFHPSGIGSTALQANTGIQVDAGVGGAGSEVSLGSWTVVTSTSEIITQMMGPHILWADIATGSRVSLRKNSADTLGGALIGWA